MFGAIGDYESISTVTVGSGGASTITFSSIPSTYQHLQLRYIARCTGSRDNVYLSAVSGDTGSNYVGHFLYGDGSSAFSAYSAANTYVQIGKAPTTTDSGWGVGVVDVLDYRNTNKYKTWRCLTGMDNNSSFGIAQLNSILWVNTAAVTSFNLTTNGNFPQYSSFALYGIKG
jgi:hypothetical protein